MTVRPTKQMKKRMKIILFLLLTVMISVSVLRFVYIMVINGEKYQGMASRQQLYDTLITAPRGDIYDRNMKTLATSSPAWTVYITPNSFKSVDKEEAEKVREKISDGLSEILKIDKKEIREKTEKDTYYVIVKKKIEKGTADTIREFISENKDLKLSNYIGLDTTTKRYYPNDSLASAVLGFVGDDEQGLAGLESYYNNELTGVSGRVVAAKNAKGTDMPFTYQKMEEAKKGNSIVTTLDSYVQYTCEKYLDAAVAEEQVAERGAAIVMNVNNGEILGMAVSGGFNPNEPFKLSKSEQKIVDAQKNEKDKAKKRNELLNRQWRNKAVSDTYEPGSVFKIFTAATAIEEGLVNKNSTFNCNYTYMVAGNTYHCHLSSGHGIQNMAQAMSNSCNPAFIQIGQRIGSSVFSKYFKAFGLTSSSGIDLPGEAMPNYHDPDKMGPTELASSSFGQTFNITPLHMISIAAAAVNGGYLVQPHIAQKIVDSEGKTVKSTPTAYKRQVVSSKTSETLRDFLEYVIQNGARNGIVAGYRVGGKTGTSQKISKILTTGKQALYIGSYVGVAPINDPDIAVFVMLDEPMSGRYYGGTISAPVGAKIMKDVLPYLGHEPQYSAEELKKLSVSVPNVVGSAVAAARDKMTSVNLTYKVVGEGGKIKKQYPKAGTEMSNGGMVILYTDNSKTDNATVPTLTRLTVAELTEIAKKSGVNVEVTGNTSDSKSKSVSQSIAPGTSVPAGTVVTVSLRDEGTPDIAGD